MMKTFLQVIVILLFLVLFTSGAMADLSNEPYAYYNFDEASGNLIDQIGSNDGVGTSITQGSVGIIEDSYTFAKASASRVTLTTETTPQAISIWYYYTGTAGQGLMTNNANNNVFTIETGEFLGTYDGVATRTSTTTLSTNVWTHIVYTYSGGTYIIYKNGVYSSAITSGQIPVKLFGRNSGGGSYDGRIDEVAFFDTNLTASDVSQLYNGGAGLAYPFTITPKTRITWNIYQTDTSNHLTGVSADCNVNIMDFSDQNSPITGILVDQNTSFSCVFSKSNYDSNTIVGAVDANKNIDVYMSVVDDEPPVTTFNSSQIEGTADQNITLTCTDNNSGCQFITFKINNGDWNYYTIGDNPLTIIYNGVGNNNIQYYSTDTAGNIEEIKTSYFTTYGYGKFSFFDETNNDVNTVTYTVSPSINGVVGGTTGANILDLNFLGITNTSYTFTLEKTGYATKTFTLILNELTQADYDFGFITNTNALPVNFQVFTLSGGFASNKQFFAYDYVLNKYIEIKTTDSLGRMTMTLNQTKSDYNFFSTDLNFGTTVWTIEKPRSVTTLLPIDGNWQYSITGASYSSQTNIASGVQKLLLQNTVNPYYITIRDDNGDYYPSSFGLRSVTSETTKTLSPYLYPVDEASLKIIKLIDYTTNQPHANPEELSLYLFTDSNGLIQIGTFINDSTGTYNIYMDSNARYDLRVLTQSYILNPVLDVYYLYLTEDTSIVIDNNFINVDLNVPLVDFNLPPIFGQLRQVAFGCPADTSDCNGAIIFSLIALAIIMIILSLMGLVNPIAQTVSLGIFLTIFVAINFIPFWLYGIGIVILIAWGVFNQ